MYKTYCKENIQIFPCNADKTPQTINGFRGASIHWPEWTGELIGVPTGNINGLVVIDLDVKDGYPVESLVDALQEYGPVPETFTVETPSGGRHLYYKVDKTNITVGTRYFDKKLPIDIRGNGGYVIGCDDNNYFAIDSDIENILEKCTPLPEWIEQYRKPSHGNGGNGKTILPPDEIEEIRSALTYIDADDRDTWVNIGMALKATGDKAARGLWDEWSQKSDKYDPKDQTKKWETFKPSSITIASIFHEAKKNGWVTTYSIKKNYEIEEKIVFKNKFPHELLSPPGLVGEIVQYINYKSIKEQPILALGASLSAVGALQGQKIQTSTGIRTNIYCIGIGESGCGKEAARKIIKELFHYSGCGEMAAVEDIASDSAIITALEPVPSQVFLLDEIGRFLRVTNTDTKNPHLFNIISVLMKMYSTADQMYYGKIYADKDHQKQIDNPNLCLYGTTVPSVLYQGLTANNITDGLLSRMMLFESETPDPPKNRKKNFIAKPPDNLIDKIKLLREKPKSFHGGFQIDPQIVPLTEKAEQMIIDFDEEIRNLRIKLRENKNNDAVYNRTSQTAEQIALILAGGIDIKDPIITETEIDYGIKLARHLSDNLLYIVENYISENEHEGNVNKIFSLIQKSKHGLTMSEITRRSQNVPGYVREDIIKTLMNGNRIITGERGEGKKKAQVFYAAQ